jgi:hypothetical protein
LLLLFNFTTAATTSQKLAAAVRMVKSIVIISLDGGTEGRAGGGAGGFHAALKRIGPGFHQFLARDAGGGDHLGIRGMVSLSMWMRAVPFVVASTVRFSSAVSFGFSIRNGWPAILPVSVVCGVLSLTDFIAAQPVKVMTAAQSAVRRRIFFMVFNGWLMVG